MWGSLLLPGVKRLGAQPLPTLLPALDKLSLLPEFSCDSFITATLVTIMSAPGFQLCPWPFLSLSTQQSWCGCHGSPLCHILFHSGHRNTCTLAPAAYTSAEQRPHWAPACQLLFVGCSRVEGGLISQVPAIGQEEMTSSCSRRGLDWILGAKSSQKELSSTGTGCPDKKLSHHPLKSLKAMYLCPWGTWFSEGLGSVRLMAGLMVLEIFFNLSNSMKIFLIWTPQYSRKSWPQISLWNRAQSYLGGHRGRIIISEKIRIKIHEWKPRNSPASD